ncbi:GroES-like protein [Trametes maxima]|nr:GroES-like protein [Trametes maxima]
MSIPTQQKALFLPSKGAAFVVQPNDVPKPGPEELLVKVEVAGLNPLDWKIQELGFFVQQWPVVLGFDAAGTVLAVGEKATSDIKVGDRVATQGNFTNSSDAFQQYVSVPAEFIFKLPDNVSFEEGATVAICATTPGTAIYNKSDAAAGFKLIAPWEAGGRGAYAGKPVLVLGGSTSVAQYAIQFLKLSGFSPIITTASPRNAAFVQSLGATHVLDRALPADTLRAEILKIAGTPLAYIFDAVSERDTQNLAYDVAAPGGTIVVVVPDSIDAAKKADGKNVRVEQAQAALGFPQNAAFGRVFVKELPKLLGDGSVKPNPTEVLPGGLEAVSGGLARLKAGAVSAKKLVIRPQETA